MTLKAAVGALILWVFLTGFSLYMLYCCFLVILRRFGFTRHQSYLDTSTNRLFIKVFGTCPRDEFGEYGNSVGARLLGVGTVLFVLALTAFLAMKHR